MNLAFQLSLLLAELLILPSTIYSSCHRPVSGHPQGLLTLTEEGCSNKTVRVKVCQGDCSSICYPEVRNNEVQTRTVCHGCAPKEMVVKYASLQCGSRTRNVTYQEASKCECHYLGVCEIGSRKRRSVNETEVVPKLVKRAVQAVLGQSISH